METTLQLNHDQFKPFSLLSFNAEEGSDVTSQTTSNVFWEIIHLIQAIFQTLVSPIYGLYDDAIGNLLGLEVLRHGTCFPHYVSILTSGADPNHGGSAGGSSAGFGMTINEEGGARYIEDSRNHVYVFADSNAGAFYRPLRSVEVEDPTSDRVRYRFVEDESAEYIQNSLIFRVFSQVAIRIFPTAHATLAGVATFTSGEENAFLSLIKGVAGGVIGFLTPTLRFKYRIDEITPDLFKDDLDYDAMAIKTTHPISPERIGITGSLNVGLNWGVFHRIAEHPFKFLLGLIELVAAVALSILLVTALPGAILV